VLHVGGDGLIAVNPVDAEGDQIHPFGRVVGQRDLGGPAAQKPGQGGPAGLLHLPGTVEVLAPRPRPVNVRHRGLAYRLRDRRRHRPRGPGVQVGHPGQAGQVLAHPGDVAVGLGPVILLRPRLGHKPVLSS